METYGVDDAAFAHGYLVLDGAPPPPETAHWLRTGVGGYTYLTHPRTVVTHVSARLSRAPWAKRAHVVLLGHPVDVASGRHDPVEIAGGLLTTLISTGVTAAVKDVAYLGGRFTAFLHHARDMTVVPDTHATQPTFWSVNRQVAVASHAALVAAALTLERDERALALYDGIRAIRPKGTIFMPGMSTPWQEVRPLIPNCRLDVDRDRTGEVHVRHTRFWPIEERVEDDDVDRVYGRFRELFLGHVGLLGQFGRTGVSLTAGLDSRLTLAAVASQRWAFAFTYANPLQLGQDSRLDHDVAGARALAATAGIPHHLLFWRTPESCAQTGRAAIFRAAYDLTWPEKQGSVGAAYAMYADLPHDFFELQSNLAETGTTHTRERTAEGISPQRLAVLWLGRAFARRAAYRPAFADFIDYAEFSADRLMGYDHHDVFYWEHRMSRWAARKFQEGDMSHRVLLPFNDRRLLETMLSLPEPLRAAKVLHSRFLDEFPELRDAAPSLAHGS